MWKNVEKCVKMWKNVLETRFYYTTVKPYKMAADFYKIFGNNITFSTDQDDYKNIYPIYAFNVSRQTERLKYSPIDVRISATFKEAVGHSSGIAYVLILSDKIINLQSDGNKMIVY